VDVVERLGLRKGGAFEWNSEHFAHTTLGPVGAKKNRRPREPSPRDLS
jgi:hypothetical protein